MITKTLWLALTILMVQTIGPGQIIGLALASISHRETSQFPRISRMQTRDIIGQQRMQTITEPIRPGSSLDVGLRMDSGT